MLTFHETCEEGCTPSLKTYVHLLTANVDMTSVFLLLCQLPCFVEPEVLPALCLRDFSFSEIKKKKNNFYILT